MAPATPTKRTSIQTVTSRPNQCYDCTKGTIFRMNYKINGPESLWSLSRKQIIRTWRNGTDIWTESTQLCFEGYGPFPEYAWNWSGPSWKYTVIKDSCRSWEKLKFQSRFPRNWWMSGLWKLVIPLIRYWSFKSSSMKRETFSLAVSTKIFSVGVPHPRQLPLNGN